MESGGKTSRSRRSLPSRFHMLKSKPSTLSPWRLANFFLLLLSIFCILFLLYVHYCSSSLPSLASSFALSPTRPRHLFFAVASSHTSWPHRKSYVRLWYSPNSTRALAFLDCSIPDHDPALPPLVVSEDTSIFPYTLPGGLRSAIRVARVVKETVNRNEPDVRWFVFGDDDTVFFVNNLVKVLSKYDHRRWFYVGSNSESHGQNVKYSFDMAFGGAGFAISASLAKVLASVLDSCLIRYSHLYGSDSRIFSCLAELGVGLTHEPGFHQVDIRGNLFGMLCAHPLTPLLSLHHLDAVEPIFPDRNRTQGVKHLFEAVHVDPARVLQQSVCYDRANRITISVSWGYAIQLFPGNELLPDLLTVQKTFTPWRRGSGVPSNFMFATKDYPKDSCGRPSVFFLDNVVSDGTVVWSRYTGHVNGNCPKHKALKNLKLIRVFSRKLVVDVEQLKAPRRHCCDIAAFHNKSMDISVRQCGENELIVMPENP